MSAHYLIRLMDDQGGVLAEIQDVNGVVDEVLVPHGQAHRGLARYIDPYGKTSFNGAQCEALLEEIDDSMRVMDQSREDFLVQLRVLLRRAVDEVHMHLVFLGD